MYSVKPTPTTNGVGSPAAQKSQNFTFTHLYASAVVATVAKFGRVTYHDKAKKLGFDPTQGAKGTLESKFLNHVFIP